MNRFGINKISSVTLLTIGFAFASFATAPSLQAGTVEECSKEALLSFFPEQFVALTLQKYQVSQEKWEPIIKGLKEKNDDVIKLVDEQASKIVPNPLKDPSQKLVAVKIYRESLYQVFSGVLKANGISDDQKIQAMLGEIQQLKTKRFAQCLETNKSPEKVEIKVEEKKEAPAEKLAENDKPHAIKTTPEKAESKDHDKKAEKKENDDDDDEEDDEDYDDEEEEGKEENKNGDKTESKAHRGALASSELDDFEDEDEY